MILSQVRIDSRSVLVEQGLFTNRRSLVLEVSTWDWERDRLDEGLLNEGLGWDLTKEALSWAVKSLASYGSAAGGALLTAPAGAEGVALGPLVDTVLDSWGLVDTVTSAIETVRGISGKLQSFSGIVNEVIGAFRHVKEDFEKFYKTTCKVVGKGIGLLGKGGQRKVLEFSRKLKTKVEEIVGKIVDAVTSSLKFLIPDSTVGSMITAAIRTIISGLVKKPYTSLGKAVKNMGKLMNFIVDPEWAPRFVNSMITKLVSFSDSTADKFEEAKEKEEKDSDIVSKVKTVAKVMSPGYFLYSKAKEKYKDPETWRAIAAKLDKMKPKIVKITETISKIVVPTLFALLSTYQAIATGDFMQHTGIEDKDAATAPPAIPPSDGDVKTATKSGSSETPIVSSKPVSQVKSSKPSGKSKEKFSLSEAIFSS